MVYRGHSISHSQQVYGCNERLTTREIKQKLRCVRQIHALFLHVSKGGLAACDATA